MEEIKRARNFTAFDKNLLTDIVTDYLHIIDNKKTDATNVKMKQDTWEEVAGKFNASSQSGKRTAKQLHALYNCMKKKARKNIADDKLQIKKLELEEKKKEAEHAEQMRKIELEIKSIEYKKLSQLN
ncbi:hypothetical protein RI129_003255 [Pyrocoelia pectoralis]|uniref:Regulatory protein zeste n=1 Tax=Pyrocoelia pectoralis TaxID=417401 RepID=A0AAN7VQ12_9COLE